MTPLLRALRGESCRSREKMGDFCSEMGGHAILDPGGVVGTSSVALATTAVFDDTFLPHSQSQGVKRKTNVVYLLRRKTPSSTAGCCGLVLCSSAVWPLGEVTWHHHGGRQVYGQDGQHTWCPRQQSKWPTLLVQPWWTSPAS